MSNTPPPLETPAAIVVRSRGSCLARSILLWGVFFIICFGLGYPTLNRYDSRKALPDSASYARLATDGPSKVEGYFRFRILTPYLVRPLYLLANGRVRSWDALLFGFLLVNSFFVASTATLLFRIGYAQLGNYSVALVGALLYLLNFTTPNAQLAGLVDAAEGFFLMAVVVSLFLGKWWLLPVVGILGALAKESFVPFSVTMAATWWLSSERFRNHRLSAGSWIAGMATLELVTVTALQSSILGRLTWPWSFARGLDSHANHLMVLAASLVDKDSWYILIWLLPLGLLRIRQFPHPWIRASAAASFLGLLLNAYHTLPGVAGGVGRCIFSVAGPLLSLSTAAYLCETTPGSQTQTPSVGPGARRHSVRDRLEFEVRKYSRGATMNPVLKPKGLTSKGRDNANPTCNDSPP